MTEYFDYDDQAVEYLKKKDRKLGEIIDRVGHVYRPVDSDVFSAVVHQIIGQQISTKALATIWKRMRDDLGEVDSETVLHAGIEKIQSYGTTYRKAGYIFSFAEKVRDGRFDPAALEEKTDREAIKELTALDGIGTWTAEMVMLFGMQRQDILSRGDLAIIRGMRMVYRHRKIDDERFETYRRRYSPYGSVASLYLWAVACGAIPGLTDPAAAGRSKK